MTRDAPLELQGAYIEHKASAIVWHYRDCDEEHTRDSGTFSGVAGVAMQEAGTVRGRQEA